MKKLFIVCALILGITVAAAAQPRALGVRLGGDLQISYQHSFGSNFLEVDLGTTAISAPAVSAGYDFSLLDSNNFCIYLGPSASLAFWDGLLVGIGAQIGVEYAIPSIPLNLSLDWKPTYFIAETFIPYSAALGIRYRF